MELKALMLTPEDSVATALQELKAGETFLVVISGKTTGELKAVTDVPYGFKVAVKAMKAGDSVIKYSHVIGRATGDIRVGELVHVHNIEGNRGRGDLERNSEKGD